ncbi:MAG TPA: TetR/AcrR family transcriptional regulator [Pseudonocardia sp.]|nr:TetR/AcrR family transcriptional regulator [Pseudonocardia sp.]
MSMSKSETRTEDRRRTRAATRDALLGATKRLLAGGTSFAALKAEHIVEEAGMSRATFYLHFRDKSELVAALAADQVAWREEIGAEALTDSAMRRETLHAMITDIVARWAENHAVLSAIIEVAEYDPAMADTWRTAMHDVSDKAAAQFRARWAGHSDGPRDPDTVAEIFTWMFERSCHQILRDPTRQAELAESMVEIIWRVLDYRA